MKAGESKKLMKAMGAKSFDPMPPDQHKWQQAKGEPPIHRIWSWLCAHTIHWNGQERSAFAIDKESNDLFIDHLAKDLWGPGDVNLANAKQHWQDGKARGLWRNGTKEEGKRRLYLCGEVIPGKPDQTADPEKSTYILIPDQILKKTKDWSPEKQYEFREWWNGWAPTQKLVSDTALAEVVGATRSILDRSYDTALAEWGLAPNRQEHTNGKSPEEREARQKRLELLLPIVEKYVHTVAESVQTPETAVYKGVVQSQTAAASLLSSENTREEREPEQSGSSKSGSHSSNGSISHDGKKSGKQLPAHPESAQRESEHFREVTKMVAAWKPTENEVALFEAIRRWQKSFPDSGFGMELISPVDKGHLTTVRQIVTELHNDVAGFIPYAQAKISRLAERHAFGKRAGSNGPGGRTLGLILEWAKEFTATAGNRAAQAEKAKAIAAAASRQRKAAEIEALQAIAADPNETDEVRADCSQRSRELLEAYRGEEATHA